MVRQQPGKKPRVLHRQDTQINTVRRNVEFCSERQSGNQRQGVSIRIRRQPCVPRPAEPVVPSRRFFSYCNLPKTRPKVKTLIPHGFPLDIFSFSLIIPPCPNYQRRSRYDVGNNSTKKQSQAKEGAGFQETDEHGKGPGSY